MAGLAPMDPPLTACYIILCCIVFNGIAFCNDVVLHYTALRSIVLRSIVSQGIVWTIRVRYIVYWNHSYKGDWTLCRDIVSLKMGLFSLHLSRRVIARTGNESLGEIDKAGGRANSASLATAAASAAV